VTNVSYTYNDQLYTGSLGYYKASMSIGDTITVRIDSRNPSVICDSDSSIILEILGCSAFAFVGIILIFFGVRFQLKYSKDREDK
jgi:hypothetical protein